MFKIGYWYKWNDKNIFEWNYNFYNKTIKWNKCIKVEVDKYKTKYYCGLLKNINWFDNIEYKYFKESKYNPDIKRKLRRILNDRKI